MDSTDKTFQNLIICLYRNRIFQTSPVSHRVQSLYLLVKKGDYKEYSDRVELKLNGIEFLNNNLTLYYKNDYYLGGTQRDFCEYDFPINVPEAELLVILYKY